MRIHNVTPILRMFDEVKAKAFYVDFLGFHLDWEHRFEADMPLYMQVSRSDCVLHLSEHHGDSSPGAHMRIEVDDIDQFHAELIAKHFKYARPGLHDTPWGSRDTSVTDPFGNKLTFTGAITTSASL
jgi:uncharacterized glyoxalase superfamily protein PhnB